MYRPCIFLSLLIGDVIALAGRCVLLFLHAVQVLVQPVKEEREELLRVVLLVAAELWREVLQPALCAC